jgi:hypothetical protein
MSFQKSRIFLCTALALMAGQGAFAHGTGQQGGEAVAPVAASLDVEAIDVTVTETSDAHVVGITRGTQVHLTVRGTAASELHLHGYDAAFSGEPARAVFDAVHTGRFALKMHAEDELLGKRERAVLYLEVRER